MGASASGPPRELGTSENVGEHFTLPTTIDDIPTTDNATTHSAAHDISFLGTAGMSLPWFLNLKNNVLRKMHAFICGGGDTCNLKCLLPVF